MCVVDEDGWLEYQVGWEYWGCCIVDVGVCWANGKLCALSWQPRSDQDVDTIQSASSKFASRIETYALIVTFNGKSPVSLSFASPQQTQF
jgi:hypothetical protein